MFFEKIHIDNFFSIQLNIDLKYYFLHHIYSLNWFVLKMNSKFLEWKILNVKLYLKGNNCKNLKN